MSDHATSMAGSLACALVLASCVVEATTPDYSLDELRGRTRFFEQAVSDHLGISSGSGRREQAPQPAPPRPGDTRDRLAAAEDLYRRGDYSAATDILRPAVSFRRRVNDPAVIDLHLRILLMRGLHDEAVDWLIGQKSADIQTPYTRFNLAVALMRAGKEPEAVTLLYRLGRIRATNDETRSLRDQANLALGWHFLGRELGGNAKAAFRRVQLRGPQSNAALLGIGWAELAPQGKRQYRDYVGDEASPFDVKDISPGVARTLAERRLLEPELAMLVDPAILPTYPMALLSSDEKTALGRAVVLWQELQRRDGNDPFVWESWIALPYALEKAGIHDQAIEHYRAAITRLESLEAAMDAEAARADDLSREVLAGIDLRVLPGAERALLLPAQATAAAWAAQWIGGQGTQVVLNDLVEARQSIVRIEGLTFDLKGAESAGARSSDTAGLRREADILARLWRDFTRAREQTFVTGLKTQLEYRRLLLRRYRHSAHLALARLLDPDVSRPLPKNEPAQPQNFWQRLRVYTIGR